MAKRTIASRLRDEVGAALSSGADALKKELRAIGDDYREVGRIAVYGKKRKKAKRGPARRRKKAAGGSARKANTKAAKARRSKTVRSRMAPAVKKAATGKKAARHK